VPYVKKFDLSRDVILFDHLQLDEKKEKEMKIESKMRTSDRPGACNRQNVRCRRS
jgi:hypothetical protein